ncbi:MAG: hypothetical protein NC935_07510, partial [Candidatus Omnitrophica bacterium]|nr:hypothetical protein [Candidatus Omnitrophota bacterium]
MLLIKKNKKLTIWCFLPYLWFLFFFILFSHSIKRVYADTPEGQKEYEEAIVDTQHNLQDHSQKTYEYLLHNINIALLGPSTLEGQRAFNKGGANGKMASLIAYLIGSQPVSSVEYLAFLGENLGLPVKRVYAQGVGWTALKPILQVWRAFRNISYLFITLFFIVLGFMIMFRSKINPQTVISVETALPKVIITLLLITFSYALAGLMIDFIYVLIYLLVGIFGLFGLFTNETIPLNYILNKNPFSLVFIRNASDIFLDAPARAIQDLINGLFGNWLSDVDILGNLLGSLAKAVFGVSILFALFKVFLSLLFAYFNIVLSVIFAPFNLLFNVFPGNQAFGNWFKNLLANVL